MKDGLKWVAVAFFAALLIILIATQKDKLIKTTDVSETPTVQADIDLAIDTSEEEFSDSSVDLASGTQLAGTPVSTVDSEGNDLIGGDAVSADTTPGEKTFTILGGNFYYDFQEILVNEGDKVTINFKSVDGTHDWVLDEFNAATERVSTDGETSVTFIADKKGTFEYYCSVGSHRENGMVGTFIVE